MTGKKRLVILYTSLVFLSMTLAGCNHTMEMANCKEMFAEFPLDATVAKENVSPGYTIRINKDGMARMLLMVQDCEEGILDGLLRIRPMRMSHIWIEIDGPEETGPPLPGTTGSLPTVYYYILPHQFESGLAYFGLVLAGIDSQLVKEITLGERSGDQRPGQVIERSPSLGYRWTETSTLSTMPNIVTGKRKFYREYGWVIKSISEGTVTCNSSFLGEGNVALNTSPDSAIGRLHFGTDLKGTAHSVEMSCHAEIKVRIK
jgi:hypothetical protein